MMILADFVGQENGHPERMQMGNIPKHNYIPLYEAFDISRMESPPLRISGEVK